MMGTHFLIPLAVAAWSMNRNRLGKVSHDLITMNDVFGTRSNLNCVVCRAGILINSIPIAFVYRTNSSDLRV